MDNKIIFNSGKHWRHGYMFILCSSYVRRTDNMYHAGCDFDHLKWLSDNTSIKIIILYFRKKIILQNRASPPHPHHKKIKSKLHVPECSPPTFSLVVVACCFWQVASAWFGVSFNQTSWTTRTFIKLMCIFVCLLTNGNQELKVKCNEYLTDHCLVYLYSLSIKNMGL